MVRWVSAKGITMLDINDQDLLDAMHDEVSYLERLRGNRHG